MKTRARVLRILAAFCFAAAFLCAGSPAARAADGDFSVVYDFSPDLVGYLGADMDLVLTVTNNGATNITKVVTQIDTAAGYSNTWTGTIRPGRGVGIRLTVPFFSGDVDESRTMTVQMNNDGDAGMDGTKTFHFTVHSTHDVFLSSSVISPSGGPFHPGDTIIITMRYRNNMAGDNAYNVLTETSLTREGVTLKEFPDDDQGTVLPLKYAASSYTYTIREADAGRIAVYYRLQGDMMGRHYNIYGITQYFEVIGATSAPAHTSTPHPTATPAAHTSPPTVAPSSGTGTLSPSTGISAGTEATDAASPPEGGYDDFEVSLSADPTEIDAGGTVQFHVTVRNTGDGVIDGIVVTGKGGAAEAKVKGAAAGGECDASFAMSISETCDMSFAVIAYSGGVNVSKETNTVHITVRGSDAATASAASAAPNPSASAAGETPAPAQAQPPVGVSAMTLLVIIGVLLLAAVGLFVALMLKKKK